MKKIFFLKHFFLLILVTITSALFGQKIDNLMLISNSIKNPEVIADNAAENTKVVYFSINQAVSDIVQSAVNEV